MSVVVYPRLAELLAEQQITLAELEQRIADRFGLSVDPDGLSRLADRAPIHQTDMALAGAAAAALGVGLDDLFTVAALPDNAAGPDVLDQEESHRLATLLDRSAPLDVNERADLERLLATYGQHMRERRLHALARTRGISLEEAARERAERLAAARAWWAAFSRDPDRDQMLVEAAAALRAHWPA